MVLVCLMLTFVEYQQTGMIKFVCRKSESGVSKQTKRFRIVCLKYIFPGYGRHDLVKQSAENRHYNSKGRHVIKNKIKTKGETTVNEWFKEITNE